MNGIISAQFESFWLVSWHEAELKSVDNLCIILVIPYFSDVTLCHGIDDYYILKSEIVL